MALMARSTIELEPRLEEHRVELTGYCYRMLGSAFEAEDAVQETMVRAWKALDRFEGRSALRSWLYRIATNVCFDMLNGRERRARPMDLGPASPAGSMLAPPLVESAWVLPAPDGRVLAAPGSAATAVAVDPAERAIERETIRLAFVAALQHLPPRQRAVLILRDVLRWQASEVATLLDTSVAAVNSALQRAHATLDGLDVDDADLSEPSDPAQRQLLERYVDAFERYDLDDLLALLHEDATSNMPPYQLWLRGHDDIRAWFLGPGAECRGSVLLPTAANALPSFGQYRRSGPGGGHRPWALQVLEITDGKISGMNFFLDTEALFPMFELPAVPPR
jgi:RNA polymerase sigma-70 factor, ECF subfamily